MEIIVVLVGFSITIAIGFLAAFSWAVRSGQYDDTFTPSMRMLFSENSSKTNNNNQQKGKDQE
jgi:cbb3-type cytochrome oxidase maturation protein